MNTLTGYSKNTLTDLYALTAAGGHFPIHSGRNNDANTLVRTDKDGYIQAGRINTTSVNFTGTPTRIYASSDAYIRYMTPANFFPTLANDDNQLSITVGGQNRKLTIDYATFAGKVNHLQGGAQGSIPYQSAANTTAFLAAPTTNGYVLKYNTSTKAPYWTSDSNTYTSAYCGTSGGTAAKAASCTGYIAAANTYLHSVVRYSNSAKSAITYNVNGNGAKPIYINGTASSSSNYTLPAGSYISFYDGTKYHFRNDGLLPVLGLGSVGSNIKIQGNLQNIIEDNTKYWQISSSGIGTFSQLQSSSEDWSINSSGQADFTKVISPFGDFSSGTLKLRIIQAPITSGGTTYGVGTSGQILKSNGSTIYWASDNNSTYAAGTGLKLSGTTFNINAGDEFPEGTSNLTDGTQILTSYASNNGFDDTNAVGTVYKRNASCIYGYIKGKLDSVYLTSHQTIYNLTLQAGTFSAATFDPNGSARTVNIPTHTSHLTNNSGFITSANLSNYLQKSGGTMTGPLCWEGTTALPKKEGVISYVLTIDPFNEGGKTYWTSVDILKASFRLGNTYLPLAGGAMTSGARISASEGNLYVGNSSNAGWLYLQDCASQSGISNWTIRANGSAMFTSADIKTNLTINNTSGSYTGILFKYDDVQKSNIYQGSYALTFDANVYIGGSGKGNLQVTGTLKAQGDKFYTTTSGVYWTSDKKMKDNISSARNLNIDSLIKEFDWKDTGKHSWGFIAQELLEVLPEAVNYSEENDRYSVNYDVAHSAAIASLNDKIKQLELRIKELEYGKTSNK